VAAILTPIYEAEFLGFSYGFRPERGQHDALDALAYGLEKRSVFGTRLHDEDAGPYWAVLGRIR
jgi:hypothetical protein